MDTNSILDYVRSLEKELAAGNTTEHSLRPALKTLLESLKPGITSTNEPQHITAVGAPDFRIRQKQLTTGYVECKDIGKSLDEALKTDQLQRYLKSLHNLVVTDYLEFRWFVHGEHRQTAWLGEVKDNKVKLDKEGLQKTAELLDSFLKHEPEPIGSPKELAGHMARLAHLIRDIIIKSLKAELATGSLHAQLIAFRENLIPDLSIEQFADMYAQTVAYGLFAARCQTDDGTNFTRQNAAYLIPKTNPFLRKLFNHIAGPDLDESIVWAVDDLAQILRLAEMAVVLQNFGKNTGKDDPVVHFYETFLKEYDPKTREMRGVYYTPLPVVSYIVRSIDHILKTRFNKPQGLADPEVLILDPAVGTATFLYMVINDIHDAVVKQGQMGMWNDYVADKLLPRLFGFELLMAPYAIAHLKLGLLLKETGYDIEKDKRLNIYLTNTLDEAVKKSEQLAGFNEYIVEEANAAADVKKNKPIMVVLGNPPYSVSSANKGEYIEKLMQSYKTAVRDERNIQPLSDDYIKFIRFAHDRIEHTGYGIVGMITNNSYLSGLIHRGIREELIKSFNEIYILNLHGNALLQEKTPEGNPDKNVFDIRVGVAIVLLIKKTGSHDPTQVHYQDLWGERESKYEYLASNDVNVTKWEQLRPIKPNYFFVPMDNTLAHEYENGWDITDIFPSYSSGIKTHRDHFVVDFSKAPLVERINVLRDKTIDNEEVRTRFNLIDTRDWKLPNARYALQEQKDWENNINSYFYRPFDIRSIYYSGDLIELPRTEVMRHLLKRGNIALLTMRGIRTEKYEHIFITNTLTNKDAVSIEDSCNVFPLYLYPKEGEMQFGEGRHPNLNPEFIKTFSVKLKLKFIENGKGDLEQTFGPDDIFNYAYAVFHSPTYRTRYSEFLKIDFPRLPLTSDKVLFKALTAKGVVLVALHLLESPLLNTFITKYPVTGDHQVEKVIYDEKTQRVCINKTQYFEGVPPSVWNFHIGGYQVCEKWLKDRQKAHLKLRGDDIQHYQKIVVALKETISLMAKIDEMIPWWPVE